MLAKPLSTSPPLDSWYSDLTTGPNDLYDLTKPKTGGGMRVERPIIRYHGGKFKLAPWILQNLPSHRVYVEPFGGAASVLLLKERSYAEVYNDLDGEVVNLFRVARDNGRKLIKALKYTPFSRPDFTESYEPTQNSLEQARRTVVRAFMGFGSNAHNRATGFRSNSNRSGTTPAHDWQNYPDCLEAIIERLRGVVIENRQAHEVMLGHDTPETLHYVDPPYVKDTRDGGDDYRFEMNDEQHESLAKVLRSLCGMVVLSGYPSTLYSDLYGDWRSVTRKAFADGAKERVEALWVNDAAYSQLRRDRAQQELFAA